MKPGSWFLPQTPDVLGLLRAQVAVTIEGVDALAKWASGDGSAAAAVREAEERGDRAKRELMQALRVAFVTPLEPEDVFTLSQGVDWILDQSQDLVLESEALASSPDSVMVQMASLLGDAVRHVDHALAQIGHDDAATEAADAAIDAERELERVYYHGMAALLEVEDRSRRIAQRELYRRCQRIGEAVIAVAERVVYAVVKQS